MREAVPARPRAIVHILHGMAEHSGRYERFAEALHGAGYGAVAHDHRGHGETVAPDAALGWLGPNGWPALVADTLAVNEHIRSGFDRVPIVVFGHSMGAVASFTYALAHSGTCEGVASWNISLADGALNRVFRWVLKAQRFRRGSDVPSALARTLTFDAWNKRFAPNRTEFDWLSRDEREVDAYIADPLCGFEVTIGTWLSVLDGVSFCAAQENIEGLPRDKPVHLLAGSEDPCAAEGAPMKRMADRLRGIGVSDVTCEIVEGNRHEALNEITRDATTAGFIRWLDERWG